MTALAPKPSPAHPRAAARRFFASEAHSNATRRHLMASDPAPVGQNPLRAKAHHAFGLCRLRFFHATPKQAAKQARRWLE